MEDNTNGQIIDSSSEVVMNSNEIQNWLNLLEQPFHNYNNMNNSVGLKLS